MKIRKKADLANWIIKIWFFLLFPAVWATGFSGIKYLCEQIHSSQPVEMTAFLKTLLVLLGCTILFGRFFCGHACAFGTYGDVLYSLSAWLAKKRKKKAPSIATGAAARLRYLKYAVLLAVCLLCIGGLPQIVSQASPWTAFSHIRAGHLLPASTLDVIGIALFVLCSLGMLLEERFFCRFLCPFGAVFSLLPVLPFSQVSRRKSKCLAKCKACRNICPAGIDLVYHPQSEEEQLTAEERRAGMAAGECLQCGKCTQICPRANASSLTMPGGMRGILWDAAKALLLSAALFLIN